MKINFTPPSLNMASKEYGCHQYAKGEMLPQSHYLHTEPQQGDPGPVDTAGQLTKAANLSDSSPKHTAIV